MKKKKYRPLAQAELSLQWTRDRDGTPRFVVTGNPITEGKPFCTGVDALIFAKNFAQEAITCLAEKQWLCAFFANVKRYLDEEEKMSLLKSVHIYPNGMCGCFDGRGQQMPSLQGEWKEQCNKVLFADSCNGNVAEYYFGEFGKQGNRIEREVARRMRFEP